MRMIIAMMGFLLSLSLATAQNFVMSKGHAEVSGKTPTTNYTGVSEELKGNINTKSKEVDFKIKLESLKTGNDKRDRDMYKSLDVTAHPMATFKGKIVSPFDINKKEAQNVTVKGNFNIHGVSKEMEVKGTLEGTEKGLKLNASFPVKITDYGIERPHVLTIKAEDEHMIKVSGSLQQENATVKK